MKRGTCGITKEADRPNGVRNFCMLAIGHECDHHDKMTGVHWPREHPPTIRLQDMKIIIQSRFLRLTYEADTMTSPREHERIERDFAELSQWYEYALHGFYKDVLDLQRKTVAREISTEQLAFSLANLLEKIWAIVEQRCRRIVEHDDFTVEDFR